MAGMNSTPSPKEKRAGERIRQTLDEGDALEMGPELPEDRDARLQRNMREWQLAFNASTDPKQRELLLQERRDRQGIDFPGTAEASLGFSPVNIPENKPTAPQGFRPVDVPNFADNLREKQRIFDAEMETRNTQAGTGVGRTPTMGFSETPGGAATGMLTPRVGGDTPAEMTPSTQRIFAETMGAAVGGAVGAAPGAALKSPFMTGAGMRAGEAIGAYAGSRLAETVDPTENPHETAMIAGGWTLGTGLFASGVAGAFRHLLGKPTEAGEHLLKIMEKEGKVPAPGAVLPETSIVNLMQSVGSAEAFFGKNVKEVIKETGMSATRELRSYLLDFFRFKKGAQKGFEAWDELIAKNLPDTYRKVQVPVATFDALEASVKEWERLGLTSKVDNNLLNAVKAAQNIKADPLHADDKFFPLSMSEAEAARTFLYNRARAMAGSGAAEKGSIAGQDFSRAYRSMAEDVGKAMDDTIDAAIKNKQIPLEAKGLLEGSRSLWKQWKQGEALMDELVPAVRGAGRLDKPLTAERIETAMQSIEQQERKLGRPIVSTTQKAHLAGIARALKATHESGVQGVMNLAVRTGQLGALTYGVYNSNSPESFAGTAALALSPAALTFLVTNPKAASLLIRGMRLDPGAAASARVTRELLTMLAKEGHTNIDREPVPEE